jgi:hypothetical protein
MQNHDGYTIKDMIEIIMDDVKEIKEDVKTQNGRVRKNEIKISYIFGALAVLGAAIALARFI